MMKVNSLLKSHFQKPLKDWCKVVVLQSRILFPFPRLHELNKPVFVIGSSRSGTSKLARTLALLPDFVPLIERSTIRHTAWRIAETAAFDDINWKILQKQLIRLSGVTREKRLIEKTPANSLLAHFIGSYAKEAVFIHAVRDGRDVALSMLDHDWIKIQLSKDEPNRFWWNYVDTVDPDFRNHWKELSLVERCLLRWGVFFKRSREAQQFENRYFELEYETLCHNPKLLIEFVTTQLGISQLTDAFCKSVEAYIPRSVGRYKNDQRFTSTNQKSFEYIASRIGYKWQI